MLADSADTVLAADPAALADAADRLAVAARGFGTAGDGLPLGMAGWTGGGANGQLEAAAACRASLSAASDAFGLASGALRRYADAVRTAQHGARRVASGATSDSAADRVEADRALTGLHSDMRDAATLAAAMLRQAAAAAPPAVHTPAIPRGPAIEAISWGDAFGDVLGAGKAVGHQAESLGEAAGHDAAAAAKELAHATDSAARAVHGGLDSLDSVTQRAITSLQHELAHIHDQLVNSMHGGGWRAVLSGIAVGVGASAGLLLSRRLRILQGIGRLLESTNSGERSFIPYESRVESGIGRSNGELNENTLNPSQQSNYGRFVKKLPAAARRPTISNVGRGRVTFSSVVPGRVPGSYAIYAKTVDSTGKTVGYTKTTYLPDGSVLHVKDKMPK